ncbi:MAG: hypothetical protein AAGE96_18040 [Cyanobacteria bacterium P01_G01_bin.19]
MRDIILNPVQIHLPELGFVSWGIIGAIAALIAALLGIAWTFYQLGQLGQS